MDNNKIQLVMTSQACPEAYDAHYKGIYVGHMRLRHGYFYAECHGKTVYDAHPRGDGIFEWEERDHHLNKACQAILDEINREEPRENLFEIIDEDDVENYSR